MPSEPCEYRIRVKGRLDPEWSNQLAGMTIEHLVEEGVTTSLLSGSLADQSALSGVLATLVDLHCKVLIVESLGRRIPAGENSD